MSEKDGVKIYKPKGKLSPVYQTNTIVDNVTDPKNERVYNRSVENVILSKEEVDANKK